MGKYLEDGTYFVLIATSEREPGARTLVGYQPGSNYSSNAPIYFSLTLLGQKVLHSVRHWKIRESNYTRAHKLLQFKKRTGQLCDVPSSYGFDVGICKIEHGLLADLTIDLRTIAEQL